MPKSASFLSKEQVEKGYNKCLEILDTKEAGTNKMILYGEAGVGKTRISAAIAQEFVRRCDRRKRCVILFLMKRVYFADWVKVLQILFPKMQEVDWHDESTWLRSNYVFIDTEVIKSVGLDVIHRFLQHVATYQQNGPLFLFIDLNYLLYNDNADRSRMIDGVSVLPIPVLTLLAPLEYSVFRYVSLMIMDEADFPRSSAMKERYHRTTIKTIVHDMLPDVPCLINNATPLGGKADDIRNIADFFKITGGTDEDLKEKVKLRIAHIKKEDVGGDKYPPIAVYAVNVDGARTWLNATSDAFLKQVCLFINDVWEIENKHSKNKWTETYYLTKERFFALFWMICQCADTYRPDYKGRQNRLLVTVSRIQAVAIVRQLFEWIFGETDEEFLPAMETLKKYFVKVEGYEKPVYRFKHYPYVGRVFAMLFHTGAGSLKVKYHIIPRIDETPDNEVQSNRDIFRSNRDPCDARTVALVYIQSSRGVRGWGCNSQDGSFITHVKMDGFDFKFSDNIQMAARTHRFDSKEAALVVAFSVSDENDIKKNFHSFADKNNNVFDVIGDKFSMKHIQTFIESAQSDIWKAVCNSVSTLDSLKTLCFNPPSSLQHDVPGVVPVPFMCVNV